MAVLEVEYHEASGSWRPATLSVPTAAPFLGVSVRTSYELIKNGGYPIRVLKVGSRMKIATADLMHYLGVNDSQAGAA